MPSNWNARDTKKQAQATLSIPPNTGTAMQVGQLVGKADSESMKIDWRGMTDKGFDARNHEWIPVIRRHIM